MTTILSDIPPLLIVAAKAAEHSTYKQKLGAIIVKSGRILGKGSNGVRHHRFSAHFRYPHVLHAEISAILKSGKNPDRLVGSIMYVARLGGNNDTRLSKPCKCCQEVLRKVGIKRVVYTNNEGGWNGMCL